MRAKLSRPRNTAKGDWRHDHLWTLATRLDEERHELNTAIDSLSHVDQRQAIEDITNEAADVANFAMMIADKARSLRKRLKP